MKGSLTPYAIFIVILIGISLFIVLAVTWHWFDDLLPDQANRFSCSAKLLNYCTEWQKKEFGETPYGYADKKPTDCEKYLDVPNSGPEVDKCRELLGLK